MCLWAGLETAGIVTALPLYCRDEIKKKAASRWDTPSPDADLTATKNPSYYSPSGVSRPGFSPARNGPRGRGFQNADGSDDEVWVGFGRGRGKKKNRKNKKKGGKNK